MPAYVGKPAPQWKGQAVVEGEFKTISNEDFKDGYLVLFFYPADFTFVCPTEIVAFSDRIQEFKDIGCAVVGCSVDNVFSHLAWISQSRKEGGIGGLRYPLLSDMTKQISRDYGVLIEEGPDAGIALRGLFIIAPDGRLRQSTINDLPIGRSVDETLRLVKALQFTDEHGEVCPAGWHPGGATIKPSTQGSKSYFATQ